MSSRILKSQRTTRPSFRFSIASKPEHTGGVNLGSVVITQKAAELPHSNGPHTREVLPSDRRTLRSRVVRPAQLAHSTLRTHASTGAPPGDPGHQKWNQLPRAHIIQSGHLTRSSPPRFPPPREHPPHRALFTPASPSVCRVTRTRSPQPNREIVETEQRQGGPPSRPPPCHVLTTFPAHRGRPNNPSPTGQEIPPLASRPENQVASATSTRGTHTTAPSPLAPHRLVPQPCGPRNRSGRRRRHATPVPRHHTRTTAAPYPRCPQAAGLSTGPPAALPFRPTRR